MEGTESQCLDLPAPRAHLQCPRARRARADAKSDLVNVLSSLEAHWHVLEAEVIEINRDIEQSEQCVRKYGEWFSSPLQYLRELKRTKKNKMCGYPTAASSGARPPHRKRYSGLDRSQEGDNSHDGEFQRQPSGRKEAREIAREADGEPTQPPRRPTQPPRVSPRPRRRAAPTDAALPCSQPVSCLQAPGTPAIVTSGYEGGAAVPVGTNAGTHQRVIMPVSSA